MNEFLPKSWVVDDQGVRIFILAGSEKALIVDSGMTGLNVIGLARKYTNLPLELLNTHADMDHIAGNGSFRKFFMHPGDIGQFESSFGTGFEILPLSNGMVFDLGNRKLEVIHLPGHTSGSVTILDKENRCLIGGDPIQENGDIYMFGSHRNMKKYIASLQDLMKRANEFDYIYPSHAKIPVSKYIIPQLIEGASKILEGRVPGIQQEVHGTIITAYDIGIDRFLCDSVEKTSAANRKDVTDTRSNLEAQGNRDCCKCIK